MQTKSKQYTNSKGQPHTVDLTRLTKDRVRLEIKGPGASLNYEGPLEMAQALAKFFASHAPQVVKH